jgi:hypothetical protein
MSIQQLLLGASGASGYNLLRSVRFRASASAYLNRTPAGAGTGLGRTWTWSGWLKRGKINDPDIQMLLSASSSRSGFGFFTESGGGTGSDSFSIYHNAAFSSRLQTTQVFRDPSAWYHIVVSVDTTQATASDRIKIYVNGTQVTQFSSATYPAQNYQFGICQNTAHNIGRDVAGVAYYFDGYLAEVNLIDGQALTPASFGSINALTGVWQPAKYTGTYGTNGFYLPFTDNSTAAALGTDFSGNSNTWTVNNISVTAGVTYDSMTDVPTLTDATSSNYAVLNPISKTSTVTLANGNLTFTGNNSATGSIFVSSGTAYFEAIFTGNPEITGVGFGVIAGNKPLPVPAGFPGAAANLWYVYNGGAAAATFYNDGTTITATTAAIPSSGNTLQIAIDVEAGKIWYGENNVWYNSTGGSTGDPVTGANPTFTISSPSTRGGFTLFLYTFASGSTFQANFGQRPFAYTPPTGFVALNTFNLAASTIVKGNTNFNAVLYTGTGLAGNSITGVGFQPDFNWIKTRSTISNHLLTDSVRGTGRSLFSNLTDAESTTRYITSLDSDGFTVGTPTDDCNESGRTFVAWNWKAGGAAVTNTAGSISAQVSANPTAGFSVVTYTGTGANATVGHGLGVAPKMVIVKRRSATESWAVFHDNLSSAAYCLLLNLTNAQTLAAAVWNSTAPTSSVISVGTDTATNASASTYVGYCFAEIDGFSKFGQYTGNGSSDGPFVYTGFRPAFVMIKRKDTTANWQLQDKARLGYNPDNYGLFPNLTNADYTTISEIAVDFLSNGFKVRTTDAGKNASGGTYIYMAFAENPFKNSLAR